MKMFWEGGRGGGDEDCNETYLKYQEDGNVPTLQQIPHVDCWSPGRYRPAGGVCVDGARGILPACPAARHQGAHPLASGRCSADLLDSSRIPGTGVSWSLNGDISCNRRRSRLPRVIPTRTRPSAAPLHLRRPRTKQMLRTVA